MHKEDIPKTTFITHRAEHGGFLNAEATYQRMMNYVFSKQLGRRMEVYVEDMIVKIMLIRGHLDNLEDYF